MPGSELVSRAVVAVGLVATITTMYWLEVSILFALGPVVGCLVYDILSLIAMRPKIIPLLLTIAYGCAGTALIIPLDVWNRRILVLSTLLIALSDIIQYLVGKFRGQHAIGVGPSPRKSYEGYVGSVLAIPVGMAFGLEYRMCAELILAGIIGDLTVSVCKRWMGIKDISDLLGHHGGWLDRADGVYMGYWYLIFFHCDNL